MASVRTLGRLTRQIWPWFYTTKELPSAGMGNVAFLSEYLQPYTPIGPGIANRRQYWFQTPTSFQPHLIGVQGIGGLISGQFTGTALTDVQKR